MSDMFGMPIVDCSDAAVIQSLTRENAQLRQEKAELVEELLRVKDICLRECGIGIVNEVILAKVRTK